MNPSLLVAIDALANSFDAAGIQVAPVVTIEFQNQNDLDNYLNELHKTLLHYAENKLVARPVAGEINQFNDVFCVFKLRSN